jgi:DNA-binding SARP family transcriptional activator/TolB-like protein
VSQAAAATDVVSAYHRNRVKSATDTTVLSLRLLGHMRADDAAGRNVLPRTRKARAVLAILALASPRPVLRLQITALLWSQREREQARASLRQALHELQDSLPTDLTRLLIAERHHISLRGEGVWIDVAEGIQADAARVEVLEWFDAPLLEDLVGLDPAFDHWLTTERTRLSAQLRALGERMLAEHGDGAGRLQIAEQLVAIDPRHETFWRTVMRELNDQGDRPGAIAAYERCKAALGFESDARPSPETEELISRIRSGGPQREVARDGFAEPPPPPGPWSARPDIPIKRLGVRLAIAPLRAIGSSTNEELALGLAEEITTSLSRFRWISCISGERRQDELWSTLDPDFVLDGTIQQTSQQIRINARLMDMRAAGAVVWAHRFDRQAKDILALQDEIGSAIVAQLDPALLIHEGERTAARQLHNPTTQDLVLQALPPVYRLERQGFHEASRLLESAIIADPGNAVAHAWLAYWHLFLVGQGWSVDPSSDAERAAELAERAVTLDPADARALTLAGHVRSFLGKRPAEGAALHERAIALNPNLALAWCFSGLAQSYLGQHDEALRRMYQAVRLSPSDPHLFFFDHALIMPHLLLAEYENAAEIGRRAVELNPWFSSAYKGYLAALGYLDRVRECEAVLARLLELEPGFSVEGAVARSPMTRGADRDRYAEGLRRAGLPERSMPTPQAVTN